MLLKKKSSRKTIGQKSRINLEKIRPFVMERDGYKCVVSGSRWEMSHPCFGDMTLQHAVARGMGGSAKFDGIDYLRAMCAGHNGMETSHPEFSRACRSNGWSVNRDMSEQFGIKIIPVWYCDGWHLLQNGARVRISDKTAESILSDMGMTFDEDEDAQ